MKRMTGKIWKLVRPDERLSNLIEEGGRTRHYTARDGSGRSVTPAERRGRGDSDHPSTSGPAART